METTLAILMVLGIFVGIPATIGFAIAGTYNLAGHRAQKTEQKTKTVTKVYAQTT